METDCYPKLSFDGDGSIFGSLPIKERAIKSRKDRYFVYSLTSGDGELLYIGVSAQLRTRLMAHWRNNEKIYMEFRAKPFDVKIDAYLEESRMIDRYKPKLNKLFGLDHINMVKP